MLRASDIIQQRRHRETKRRPSRVAARFTAVAVLTLLFFLLLLATGITAMAAVTRNYLTNDLSNTGQQEQPPGQATVSAAPIRLYAWDEPDASGQRRPVLLNTITSTEPAHEDSGAVFEQMVLAELASVLGQAQAQRGGLDVYTSLDLVLQHQAECVLQKYLGQLFAQGEPAVGQVRRHCAAGAFLPLTAQATGGDQLDAAVFALDPITGQVRALVGDAQAGHEPGTLLAPFVYLTALSQGYNAATMVLDVETTFEQGETNYRPQNADGRFHGPLRLREALSGGYTVPAAQVMSWVGPEQVARTARSLGLANLDGESTSVELSLLSGGGSVTLAEVIFAFAALDNLGEMVGRPHPQTEGQALRPLNPATIWRVTDHSGNVLYDYQPQRRDILTPELAYLMNDMLAERTTADGRRPTVERRVAATVGTTADRGSVWAVGYMPQLVIGTWMGYGDAGAGENATGNTAAAPLWALIEWATQALPSTDWEQPPGLRELEVCDPSGLLPTADCPLVSELFIDGTQPITQDTVFRPVYVNRENGRLATVATPPHLVERQVYQLFPPEAVEWAREANLATPPREYDTLITHTVVGNGIAAIEEPEPFAAVSGEVVIEGTAAGDDFAFYRLAYFPGLYPAEVLLIAEESESKTAAQLGVWDTSALKEGLYTLLLTAISEDGAFAETSVQVVVRKLP